MLLQTLRNVTERLSQVNVYSVICVIAFDAIIEGSNVTASLARLPCCI
jgi:hypothetical protein